MRAVLMLAVLMLAVLAACGDNGQDGPATCESFISADYDRGCPMIDFSTGEPKPEAEAIADCEAVDTFACDIEWQAWLDCRAELTTCDYEPCASSLAAFTNCRQEL